MIRLLKQMKSKDRRMVLLCVLLVGGQVYFDLTLPDYTKEITTLIGMESDVLGDYFSAGGKCWAAPFAAPCLQSLSGTLRQKSRRISASVSAEKCSTRYPHLEAGILRSFPLPA